MSKFKREKDQRKALIRGLCIDLFTHKSIKTTTARAKDLRPVAEKLVTRAVKGGQANRRLVLARLGNNTQATDILFDDIAPAMQRKSGYLSISPEARRRGDNAEMSTIEFVDTIETKEHA